MADPLDGVRRDIAIFRHLLEDPVGLRAFMAENRGHLRDIEDARRWVSDIIEGLDDILHGRTVPHEDVVREARERRERYRPTAAE